MIGTSKAREALIAEYLPKIERILALYLSRGRLTGLDLEDVRSEAMIGLVAAVDSFDSNRGSLNAWADQKIEGAILDYGKRERGRRDARARPTMISLETGALPEIAEADGFLGPDPESEVLQNDRMEHLYALIQSLPTPCSGCLSLYYYENLSLREIGRRLGVSERRAGQIHQKGIALLRERVIGDAGLEDLLRL